ncbi:MAG: hypothetical protein ACE5JM_04525, partial [Armatimonadota bacterium]
MTATRCATLACAALALCSAASADAFSHHDTFEAYTDDAPLSAVWQPVSGTWDLQQGRYRGSSQYRSIALCAISPESDHVSIEATVRAHERIGSSGWSTAGVMAYVDGDNLWRFILVAGPEGQRYCELGEVYQGVWQAQREGRTQLQGTKEDGADWEYGRPYTLRLELDAQGVRGTMLDGRTGKLLGRESYVFDGAPHISSGRPALTLDAMVADFDDVRVAAAIGQAEWPDGAPAIERGGKGTLAVLIDDFPGVDRAKAEAIVDSLREHGFGVTVLDGEQLPLAGVLHPAHFDALVLPDANVFPADALGPLLRYLRMGGKMAVVGTRPFDTRVHKVGDTWVDRGGLKAALHDVRPTHIIEDFEGEGRLRWRRSSDDPSHEGTLSIQRGGAAGTASAAKVAVADLTGWDTFSSDSPPAPFPAGHTLTCFWAKGDRRTPRMSIEWREKDGSRWIAVVDLAQQWQHYALPPEDFVFWPNGSTAGRGGAGDQFDPANAEQIVFGVAYSHTGREPGPKLFWIDEVGTAASPLPELEWPPAPVLETVSPAYKLYPLTGWHGLLVNPCFAAQPRHTDGKPPVPPGERGDRVARLAGQAVQPSPEHTRSRPPVARVRLGGLKNSSSPVRRPTGQGFRTGGSYRWIPIAEVTGPDGILRGAPVSMLVNFGGMYRLSAWALFAFDDPRQWRSRETPSMLATALERMTGDLLLCEGGSEYFSYYPDELVTLGAKVVNLGPREQTATVRLTVRPSAGGAAAFSREWDVSVPARDIREVSVSWQPGRLDTDGYTVTCELIQDGGVTDSISHEIGVLEERGRLDPTSLVTVRDGDFHLRGEPWQPHGINYWALYSVASEPSGFGLGWLSPGFYQPDEVERDLRQIADLGMDVLSIQYNTRAVSRNLLDFLRRAHAHGFKVNVFIGSAEPMRFNAEATRQLIEAADLVHNEAVFAYDVSWEPHFGGRGGAGRIRYDPEWARWIVERHGSIESAERDWGVPCPRRDGAVASPSNDQLFEDGAHRVMAAAYRRFMQDFIGQRFRDAVRQLREIDPHRLISFRTGASVTGGNGRGDYSYDFATAAKHVDFLCPEGWALRDDPRPGGFATAYCHMIAPGKPVMWAEYGYNIWDRSTMAPDPKRRTIQRDRYEEFYRMF